MRGNLLVVLALVVILGPVANAVPLIDQVKNGDFEELNGTLPAHWTVLAGDPRTTTHAASGGRALEIVIDPGGCVASVSQTIRDPLDPAGLATIVPGAVYELYFFYHYTGAAGGSAQAKIEWLDASGRVLWTDPYDLPRDDAYARESILSPAPPDLAVEQARITFRLDTPANVMVGAHTLFVDDVQFGIKGPI